ncbi:MAG: hypothetical protein Q9191_005048, partial [Dirinaria sp. TL-2023a]
MSNALAQPIPFTPARPLGRPSAPMLGMCEPSLMTVSPALRNNVPPSLVDKYIDAIKTVLDTAWLGAVPVQQSGNGRVAGATRGYMQDGVIFSEQLVDYHTQHDGSFVQKYDQLD